MYTVAEEAKLKEMYTVSHDIDPIAKELGKSPQYVGKILSKLNAIKLLTSKKDGKNKYYSPSIDVIIAYSDR